MKKITFFACLLLSIQFVQAQTFPSTGCYIRYSYDELGNRISRDWYCWDNNGGSNMKPNSESSNNSEIIKEKTELNVYPNPSDGDFFFTLSKSHSESEYKITDLNGKCIFVGVYNGRTGWFNLSNFPKGEYFLNVKLNSEEKFLVQKIIKR